MGCACSSSDSAVPNIQISPNCDGDGAYGSLGPGAGTGPPNFVAYTGRPSKDIYAEHSGNKGHQRNRRRVSVHPSVEAINEEGGASGGASSRTHSVDMPDDMVSTWKLLKVNRMESEDEVEIASTIITTASQFSQMQSQQRLSLSESLPSESQKLNKVATPDKTLYIF